MEVRVLGPIQVLDAGRPLELGGPKAAELIGALVAARGEVVSQDRLIDVLWPDSYRGKHNLQSYVSRIRKRLGPEGTSLLDRRGDGYAWTAAGSDAARFEALVGASRRAGSSDGGSQAATLAASLELWSGHAFEGVADSELIRAEAVRLEELRLAVEEDLIEAELEAGHHREVIAELERLCREQPLRERLWELRILALVRADRQADALQVYQEVRTLLVEELGIEPGEALRDLEQRVLAQDPELGVSRASSAVSAAAAPSLPDDLTTFVGRDQDLAAIIDLLTGSRVVTLVGMGGVGKTRLAIRAAREARDRELGGLRDGSVGLVELGELVASDRVGDRVAEVLATLTGPHRLLLVDNCEHLIDVAADVIADLLRTDSGLQVLATSQEALRIPGETRWQVEPLPTPEPESSVGELTRNPASQLFVDRCRAIRPAMEFDEEAMRIVGRVCCHLDGIPLAIELAAGRIDTLGLRQIEEGICEQFELLTDGLRGAPARHQTLSSTIEWSYELLGERERRLLHGLRPIVVSFPARAVEVICAESDADIPDIRRDLQNLTRRNLVRVADDEGVVVHHTLRTVRDFIYRRAGWQGRYEGRGFIILLAQFTAPELRGSMEQMWSTLLDGPGDVARAALDLSYDRHDIEAGAFLAGVIAARSTETGRVGFIGGVRWDFIGRFARGFDAGVAFADSQVEVETAYLSEPPDFSGFRDTARGRELAGQLLGRGVDVIHHTAGVLGGLGVMQGVKRHRDETGERVWVIGVDLDERVTQEVEVQPTVLASVRRQIPREPYLDLKAAVAAGAPEQAPRFGLGNGGIAVSSSGGQIDHLRGEIDRLSAAIISGDISLPAVPA